MPARRELPLPSALRSDAIRAPPGADGRQLRSSCAPPGDQTRRRGTCLGSDVAAGQHTGDLLLSCIRIELLDAGHGLAGGEAFRDPPVIGPACRDLRRMCYDEDLQTRAQALQPFTDSGIGGAVAAAVGERLQRLGTSLQVLVVTHSPQVAARGAYHWRVAKSLSARETVTCVEELDADTRQEEIARMLSGRNITAEARAAAASLIAGGRT